VKVLPNELLLRDLRRSDNIVVIYGTMKNVIKACKKVLERMNEYYRKNDKSFSDYSLKMIIGA
jgi:cytochrome c-type biogenesis protein CcmE